MHSEKEFTIAELEEATGQPRRTIHHYISRGLLPKAEGSGPAARYGRDHYLRLRLIDYASQAGFRIDQKLQSALGLLTQDEMEDMVARAEGSSQDDLRSFGHWLLTGDPKANVVPSGAPIVGAPARNREARASRAPIFEERMPSTAAFLRQAARPPATSDPEQWERLRLGRDIELSWRPRYDARFIDKLRRLLQVAHELFGDEPTGRSTSEDERDV